MKKICFFLIAITIANIVFIHGICEMAEIEVTPPIIIVTTLYSLVEGFCCLRFIGRTAVEHFEERKK